MCFGLIGGILYFALPQKGKKKRGEGGASVLVYTDGMEKDIKVVPPNAVKRNTFTTPHNTSR